MPAESRAIVVTGIVRSVGGHTGGGDGPRVVLLLTPWLRDASKPVDRLLRVQIPTTEAKAREAGKTFEYGTTVRLELERLDGPIRGDWSGLGRLPIEHVQPSSALEAIRQALQRPNALEDPKLGRLTLTPGAIIVEYNDQQMNDSYDGEIQLAGQPCELSIDLTRGSRENTKAARARDRRDIAKAAALVTRFDKGLAKVLGSVAREVLPTYDKDWRGDRPALTADALRQRLAPSSLSVWSNGAVRLIPRPGTSSEVRSF